jgi:uncharacterized protein YndB with AHSA1/START domain
VNSYTNEFVIDIPTQKVYDAITTKKGLTNWWTEEVEIFLHIGGIATFHFGEDTHMVMKIAKLVPNKEVVWKCVEQHSPGSDLQEINEWVGTTIRFSIADDTNGNVKLSFTHEGLTSELVCYENCKNEWDAVLDSLEKYLKTGNGKPHRKKSSKIS